MSFLSSLFHRDASEQPQQAALPPVSLTPAGGEQPGITSIEEGVVTLLLAEDDTVLQELYADRFSEAGFIILQAFDGEEALRIIREHPEINLVLLDLMLPKVSGYDVLAQVRMSGNKSLPIIVVSALADIDDQARALQLGATDYITKGEMLPSAVIEKITRYALPVSRSAS